jgi:RES domain-containing protein
MRLWRISSFDDLLGTGGLNADGRWHTRGRRIVYLADHPASALVEVLVHLEVDPDDLPRGYNILAVDLPDQTEFGSIEVGNLPGDWLANPSSTRAMGDRWLAESRTALLRVPSAIVPFAFNWLLNPVHADSAAAVVARVLPVPLDPRLLR